MVEALSLALLWMIPALVFFGALIRPLGWPFHRYPMYSAYTPRNEVRVYALKFRRSGYLHFKFWEPNHFKDKKLVQSLLGPLTQSQVPRAEVAKVLMKLSMIAEVNGEMTDVAALQLVEQRFIHQGSNLKIDEQILYEFQIGS